VNEITEFLKQYDGERIKKFLFDIFGKYRYVHTLSEKGLDYYLSNLRSVANSHPDDIGCVTFHIETDFFNMVDYRDPKVFLDIFKRYLALKAFL